MENLDKLNSDLMGAPIGVLVGMLAIALGYFLKTWPSFDNRLIPHFVVITCATLFALLAPTRAPGVSMHAWVAKNVLLGFVIGFASWTFHAQILKRFLPNIFCQNETNKESNAPNEKK